MPTDDPVAAYLRRFAEPEDEPLRAARARSEESDIPAVAPETGAALRFATALVGARHVVEVGTGGGYSGLWLLGGIQPRGSLTTIEIDRGHQSLAQRAFAHAKAGDRVRSMLGPALQVLPKLADGNYDVVFLDADPAEYPEYLEHARRLLRPGGLLLADGALVGVGAADDAVDDDALLGIRAFNDALHDDPAFRALILPLGGGLLAAVSSPAEAA